MKFLKLVVKNLQRNKVRTVLTTLAIVALVAIFSMIASVFTFLDRSLRAKAADVPIVLTERYRIPSRFDRAFLDQIVMSGSTLNTQLNQVPGFHNENHTLWHFIGFSCDPEIKDKDLIFFCIATLPEKLKKMVDGLDDLSEADFNRMVELVKNPPKSRLPNAGIVMGPGRLAKIRKKVGDVFEAVAISHRDGVNRQPIKMQLEIVGELPGTSRWTEGAFMDYAYLDRVLKATKSELDGKIMLGWLKVDTAPGADQVSGTIEENLKEIKSEIASSSIARFLEPYQGMMNIAKYVLSPTIAVIMILIVANAISITVRERMTEMAVLKVLGFSPRQILVMVLGEGIFLGALAGLLSAAFVYVMVNKVVGGLPIPLGFFPRFFIPIDVFWWGPLMGAGTAFAGSIVPALQAQHVRVSEVFSRVT